jgi:NAD(P)-dependent dehydrogenase (short-subunit alcohol dehydrogenase family)
MGERADRAGDGHRHALVVGGSGMLAGLCRSLAEERWEVTGVGRDRSKLREAAAGATRIHPVSVDYEDLPALRGALREATARRGAIELEVCWIRSWAPSSLLVAADALAPGGRLFHLVGSQSSDASAHAIAGLRRDRALGYRQVRLGSVRDGGCRRWLTHAEICAGVLVAIRADSPRHVIGDPATR